MPKGQSVEDRFWDKTMPCPITGHWFWVGALDTSGYGAFYSQGKVLRAHRFAYEFFRDPIAEGFEVDHLCRIKSCVNPDHLEVVTHKVNVGRGNAANALSRMKRNKTPRPAGQTHCPQNHPYSGENLYVAPSGVRQCRECRRLRDRARRSERPRNILDLSSFEHP